MIDDIFKLNFFNVLEDKDNYYFFRALNMGDNKDIEENITFYDGKIKTIRTDRDRYEETPIYNENDDLTLEQMVDHIKMHQRKDTNCISLTSNANTAITYGRGNYKDKYVIVKVPKNEINNTVFQAGPYMLDETNKKIDNIVQLLIENNEIDDVTKYYLDAIDNSTNYYQLNNIKNNLPKKYNDESNLFQKGIEFDITYSTNYSSLNENQNFIKDKIVLKLDILNKQILNKVSNNILIKTIGNAFSSMELIHYGRIHEEEIISVQKEIMDVIGLIQQLPSNIPYVEEVKSILLKNINNINIDNSFKYDNYNLTEEDSSLDYLYNITQGKISYNEITNLYNKIYYLSKSKLRNKYSLSILKTILNNDSKYKEIYDYIENNTYGIEPSITTRISADLPQLSESVSLNILKSENNILEYINNLNDNELEKVLTDKENTLKEIVDKFVSNDFDNITNKEDWLAESLIDKLNLKRLGIILNLSLRQRNDIIKTLKQNNYIEMYNYLKENNVKEKDISDILFTNLIRNTNYTNTKELFTLDELEYFIGYNKVKDTSLNLLGYQTTAFNNINASFNEKQFTSVILPTGAGKSYVALAEMLNHKDEKILYLAPNEEILNQLIDLIRSNLKPEEHLGVLDKNIIKKVFPNLILDTYQHLKEKSAEYIINDNYGLIIFDELHRTGAPEWKQSVLNLLNNQNNNTKILGITATPERDADLKDMSDYFARKYGYSEKEILLKKHLSYNMDLETAIKKGIIANPIVVNFDYALQDDNEFKELANSIEEISDIQKRNEELTKYEELRRKVETSNGIEKILNDNLDENSKYIVFLPVGKKNGESYETIDGDEILDYDADRVIKDYELLLRQYIFSYNYLEENPKIRDLYNKINNEEKLNNEEIEYLNSEKDNVLMLSKIDIYGKNISSNTETNLIGEELIKYMEFNKLSKEELSKKLKEVTKDKVEMYSMLGSYSKNKNRNNLINFSNKNNGKPKLMFVMNKLNEGVHIDGINGIIWLRALNENSRILCLQQLGRCCKSNLNKKNNKIERPKVIDLVNNTLKVNFESKDDVNLNNLNRLKLISEWIINNNRYPSILSNNKEEKNNANTLRNIFKKYIKYIKNNELLNELNEEKRAIISEILSLGREIDLWDQSFNNVIIKNKNGKETSLYYEEENKIFKISSIVRDFIDLKTEIKQFDIYTFDYMYSILKRLYDQGEDVNLAQADKVRINEDGSIDIVKRMMKFVNGKQSIDNKEEYNEDSLIQIGKWLYRHDEELYNNNIIRDKLESIGYKFNKNKFKYNFENIFNILYKLYEQGDNVNLGSKYKVRINEEDKVEIIKPTDIEEYKKDDTIFVGNWLLLHKYELLNNEEYKRKLASIGYVFKESYTILDFDYVFNILNKLYKQGENVNLAQTDKVRISDDGTIEIIKKNMIKLNGKKIIDNSSEYKNQDLIRIGTWLYTHKGEIYNNIERRNKLKQIGYDFNENKIKIDFELIFNILVKLKNQGIDVNLSSLDKVRINEDESITIIKKQEKRNNKKKILINEEEYNNDTLIPIGSWLKYYGYKLYTNTETRNKLISIGYNFKEKIVKKYNESINDNKEIIEEKKYVRKM